MFCRVIGGVVILLTDNSARLITEHDGNKDYIKRIDLLKIRFTSHSIMSP